MKALKLSKIPLPIYLIHVRITAGKIKSIFSVSQLESQTPQHSKDDNLVDY